MIAIKGPRKSRMEHTTFGNITSQIILYPAVLMSKRCVSSRVRRENCMVTSSKESTDIFARSTHTAPGLLLCKKEAAWPLRPQASRLFSLPEQLSGVLCRMRMWLQSILLWVKIDQIAMIYYRVGLNQWFHACTKHGSNVLLFEGGRKSGNLGLKYLITSGV